jgi:hypothetical protein
MDIETPIKFHSGDRISLHGDPKWTGTLVNQIANSYPARWTVRFDSGQYEAICETSLSLISQAEDILFSEDNFHSKSDSSSQTREFQRKLAEIEQRNFELERQNAELQEQLKEANQRIRRAKDISPAVRPSLQRVMRLAHQAGLEIVRSSKGWLLKMGKLARQFGRLADIWLLLCEEDWYLSEIFAPELLASADVVSIAPRKRLFPAVIKQVYPLISALTVELWRNIGLPKCESTA